MIKFMDEENESDKNLFKYVAALKSGTQNFRNEICPDCIFVLFEIPKDIAKISNILSNYKLLV